jgi:hypothetical protein
MGLEYWADAEQPFKRALLSSALSLTAVGCGATRTAEHFYFWDWRGPHLRSHGPADGGEPGPRLREFVRSQADCIPYRRCGATSVLWKAAIFHPSSGFYEPPLSLHTPFAYTPPVASKIFSGRGLIFPTSSRTCHDVGSSSPYYPSARRRRRVDESSRRID